MNIQQKGFQFPRKQYPMTIMNPENPSKASKITEHFCLVESSNTQFMIIIVIRVIDRPMPTNSNPTDIQIAFVANTTINDPIQIEPPVR